MSKTPNEGNQSANLKNLRESFSTFHASSLSFQDKKLSALKESVIVHSGNRFYEEVQTVSYHPDFQTLEAIFAVKQSYGFGGNLCSTGSFGFVRFYIDYGAGWEDQGYVGVNEHDIPTGDDCENNPEKPLHYAASLKIIPKTDYCGHPVLPKARAILEWNAIPTANDPDYASIWGNTVEDYIQIKPRKFIILDNIVFTDIIELAIANPMLKIADAAKIVPEGEQVLQQAKAATVSQPLELNQLIELYKDKKEVSAGRYGMQSIQNALKSFDSGLIAQNVEIWNKYQIDFADILKELENTNADVNYEQIENVGLDYNREQLVAAFRIKRPFGYSGDLCSSGSLEYVAFWADWDNKCEWEYLGTTAVNVHDINNIPGNGISYAAILPYDFTHKRKSCETPNVVKIRAVLSWNTPPSTTDPEKLEYYGNRKDAYVQIKDGKEIFDVMPYFYNLGGIPVDKISDGSGLTLPGAAFALNGVTVESGAPFAGIVVIQGPSFPGFKYRIKVTNLSTSLSYYLSNPLWLAGYHTYPLPPHNTYLTIYPDANNYYAYQSKGFDYDNNYDNVLARWEPGGNDKWLIELDIDGIPGTFSKVIQMDHTIPEAILNLDNGGDCTHFHLGDTITGKFTATDNYISSYTLSSSFVGTIESGNANTINNPFAFTTNANDSPCGSIDLVVYEKTIHNSVTTGYHKHTSEIICLQP